MATRTAATSLLNLIVMKKSVVAAGSLVLLAIVGLMISRPWALDGRDQADVMPREELVHSEPIDSAELAQVDTGSRAAPPQSTAPAVAAKPRLYIVDGAGEAVPGAHVAWIDADDAVLGLELDSNGSVALPLGAAQRRFYGGAEGFVTSVQLCESEGADLRLTLHAPSTLRGRVRVDGKEPDRMLTLRLGTWGKFLQLDAGYQTQDEQRAALESLGFSRSHKELEAETLADGSFEFHGLHPASVGRVELPHSLRTSDGAEFSKVSLQHGQGRPVDRSNAGPLLVRSCGLGG